TFLSSALADNPTLRIGDIRCTKASPTVPRLEAQAAALVQAEDEDPGPNSLVEGGRHACRRRIAGQMHCGPILRCESSPIAARRILDRLGEVLRGPDVVPSSACYRGARHH